ncbi:MAG TPA: murein biosynthesis integral membrane protein MurJ [Azospirillaceae bacterium]|nr:murein biosynthesis integral membrane protein MurJ [Azospirillaceae bacterium]
MSFTRAIATVGGLTMVSRVAGFVRDMLTAWILGAGTAADIFIVAQRLPNYFRALFAEGAFTVSFVPMYSAMMKRDGPEAANRFAEQAMSVMILVLLPVTLLTMLAMPAVMILLASGYMADEGTAERLVELGRITFPYLLLISVTALQTGVLNALGRFGPGAAAPIALNICMITALGLTHWQGWEANRALAWAVTISGMVQLCWLAWSCRRAGLALRVVVPRFTPEVRKLFRQMGPGAISASVIQVNLVIGTHVASLLPAGAISYLYYADRLNQLPLGVIGIAIGTALLPTLSRHVEAGDRGQVSHYISRGIEYGLLLGLPAAVALAVIPLPIFQALFQKGNFGPAEARATALALTAYAAGIPAYVVAKVLTTTFFARQDTRTPMRIAFWTLGTNTVLAVVLALWTPLGHVGIALASGLTAWLNILLLATALRRRDALELDRPLLRRAPRIILAAALMGGALALGEWALRPYFLDHLAVRIAALGALVAGGVAVYGLLVVGLGGVDRAELKSLLRRRRAPAAG